MTSRREPVYAHAMKTFAGIVLGLSLLALAPACGGKATCEDAVKKMASLDPDMKDKSAEDRAKKIEKMTTRCNEEKPKQEDLDCVMKAADMSTAMACVKGK